LEQITSTRPCRRMILHFSHIGLTDGLTFTSLRSRGGWFRWWTSPAALETGTVAATASGRDRSANGRAAGARVDTSSAPEPGDGSASRMTHGRS